MTADVHTDEATESQALPLRPHTILGVCEALGEDFGFNPVLLRVPFAASVLVSPLYAVLAYLALGLLVLGSRLIFPKAKAVAAVTVEASQTAPANCEDEARLAA